MHSHCTTPSGRPECATSYDALVIRRLYVHNFRCLENFKLPIDGQASTLLIGNNGSGKTTVGLALKLLQEIGRGKNRVGALLGIKDATRGRTDVPIRFEIDVELKGQIYEYAIAFELPEGFRELRVLEEKFSAGGKPVYTRSVAQVTLARAGLEQEAKFRIDWHLVALPIVQEQSTTDPLYIFRQWLAHMLILRPIPSLITGESTQETREPNQEVTDFGGWFSGLVADAPSAYAKIDSYLKEVMPDFSDIKNPLVGTDARSLLISFSNGLGGIRVPFGDLSDGEKCFMICALVLAASETQGQVFCFWDEPDNFLALSEVGHFILALRRAFQSGDQFVATSHNPEAIRSFSDDNTLVLHRRSHLEPTMVRLLSELQVKGDLVDALIRGDVEP